MLFKGNKISQLEREIDENFRAAHNHTSHVEEHLNSLIEVHNGLAEDFHELKEELATNGVVRDLRKLEKQFDALENGVQGLVGVVQDKFDELNNNGVASAINKLNAEVFGQRKSKERNILERLIGYKSGMKEDEEATLAGKVDAIIAHLGIDVTVQPEETKPAEVVAKKQKAVKKKGSRR